MSKLIFEIHGKFVKANIIDSVIKCTYYTFNLTIDKYKEIIKYMNGKTYHTVGMNIITGSNERILLVILNKSRSLSINIKDIYNDMIYEELIEFDDITLLK